MCQLMFSSYWSWWAPTSAAGGAPTRGEVLVSTVDTRVALSPTSESGSSALSLEAAGAGSSAYGRKSTWSRIRAASVGCVFLIALVMPLWYAWVQVQDLELAQDGGTWWPYDIINWCYWWFETQVGLWNVWKFRVKNVVYKRLINNYTIAIKSLTT